MKLKLVSLFAILFILSCTPEVEDIQNSQADVIDNSIKTLEIPNNFNFETTTKVDVSISVKSITDKALSGVKVSFYTDHPDFEGKYLTSAFTNSAGVLDTKIELPTYLKELFVQVHSIGFANQKTVDITPVITIDFGGRPESNTSSKSVSKSHSKANREISHISDNFYYIGEFTEGNWRGLPLYLEDERDQITQEFLDDVNASLPENKPVPEYNPQYLTNGNELDVVVIEKSDVWVTFVSEGAGYRNSLGYYVFDTDNPPANPSEIDSIFVLLPNTSLAYSSGELNTGDKVKIGTFEAGKSISWVLFQDAWNGTGVDVNKTKFFSRSEFNTNESDPTKRQHTVQLADFGRELLLNGFEDQTRSRQSDNDFNDLIFYVTANPWEGIKIGNTPQVKTDEDSDGDGVSDSEDDFPNDPKRVIRNTYEGSIAYEDLWPVQGDYDFNDVVIDYEVDHILNANNELIDIEADWTVQAVFAAFTNGFGVQLGTIKPVAVESVSGQNLQENIISNNGNGTESNQSEATVIFFDDASKIVRSTLSSKITFTTPVSQNDVGLPPYNPFIFVDGDRAKEVHLPGHLPTDLVNKSLFGNGADATNLPTGYTYKTANGLPWAIHIPESFDFPRSTVPINEAYLKFEDWATSGGTTNADWYKDLPGYRDSSKIH